MPTYIATPKNQQGAKPRLIDAPNVASVGRHLITTDWTIAPATVERAEPFRDPLIPEVIAATKAGVEAETAGHVAAATE